LDSALVASLRALHTLDGGQQTSYKNVKALAQGGFAKVYAASAHDGSDVVIKVPKKQTDEASSELRDEALLWQQGQGPDGHRNVCRLREIGLIDGRMAIVADRVDGLNMRQAIPLLRDSEDISYEQKNSAYRYVARQMLTAIQHVHANGVLHQDIKPENFMFDTKLSEVKLVDFGSARRSGESGSAVPSQIEATPEYVAPERILQRPVDAAADVWSFAMMLNEMFTGERRFRITEGPLQTLNQVRGFACDESNAKDGNYRAETVMKVAKRPVEGGWINREQDGRPVPAAGAINQAINAATQADPASRLDVKGLLAHDALAQTESDEECQRILQEVFDPSVAKICSVEELPSLMQRLLRSGARIDNNSGVSVEERRWRASERQRHAQELLEKAWDWQYGEDDDEVNIDPAAVAKGLDWLLLDGAQARDKLIGQRIKEFLSGARPEVVEEDEVATVASRAQLPPSLKAELSQKADEFARKGHKVT
jgi:serine/threonine protein kinase